MVAPLTTKNGSIQEIKATMGKSMSKVESKIEGRISLLETFIESKFDQHVYKRSDEVEALTMKGQCYPDNDDDDNNN